MAFFVPIILYSILCSVKNIYPFGQVSNLIYDLDIQYVDFYAYYRRVLLGQAELSYSFVKSLGGSLVALWGYYLASPLNLLVVFFKPEQMQMFVFVITAIKIGLCGTTSSFFVKSKYRNMQDTMVICLAVAYSFTQYVVGQMSNLNWLDGVYLLPLILWGIDKYIYEKKKAYFYVFLAISIIFNWYTGYMNCIFVVLYFCYQFIVTQISEGMQFNIKKFIKEFAMFIWLEFLSVLLSLCVFLPVLLGQSGGRSAFDEGIFQFGTNGSLLDILRGFMIGSANPSKDITLFCSVFLLVILVYYIFDRKIQISEKRITLLFLTIMVFSLFFKPIEHIWVGFKFENSYAYRFLYLVIMVLILICARVLEHIEQMNCRLLGRTIGWIIFSLLALDMVKAFDCKHLWLEIALLVLYGGLLVFRKKTRMRKVAIISMIFVFLGEIIINAALVIDDRYAFVSEKYVTYVSQEEKLFEQIRTDESEFYRIEKTLNRDENMQHNSFYANESMAYLYSGIQSYISSYDLNTAEFIRKLGYSRSEFPSFYHEPILPADSLLGVRYLLSERQYDGFELKEGMEEYNGKYVYENVYALPLAFSIERDMQEIITEDNPFEYINEIYSCILGKEARLFKRIEPSKIEVDEEGMKYAFSSVSADSILYAKINGENLNLSICLNDNETYQSYSTGWINQNVVIIGNMEEGCSLKIMDYNEDDFGVLFYAMDLNDLEETSKQIKTGEVRNLVANGNKITFESEAERVMLTIPYDEAWEVTVNGKKVEIQKGADALVIVPLNEGETNFVTMQYRVRGKEMGIGLSIFSVVLFAFWIVKDKRKEAEI